MRARAAALAAIAFLAGVSSAAAPLRLGATHTLEDSGVLAILLPAFTAVRGIAVVPLVAATGQVMKYAENGDVDVVFTHSRRDEESLIARGIGKARADVMWNDFVVAGPAADPARVRGMKDAAAALKRIRDAGAKFTSRGDDSGTHKTELRLWEAVGGHVPWKGYLSVGQGAGRTLAVAHELDAYDLIDRATLKMVGRRFPLAILVEGDPRLLNEYGVTTLKPSATRRIHEAEAAAFAAWLVSAEARRLIAAYRIDGERVFHVPGEPAAAR